MLLTTAEPTVWHGAKYFTRVTPGIVRATIISPVFQMGQVEAQRSSLTCPRSHNSEKVDGNPGQSVETAFGTHPLIPDPQEI